MATQLFLLDAAPTTHLGTDNADLRGNNIGWSGRALGTARGGGVAASTATATVAGTTPGVEIQVGAVAAEWISPPVSADVTISGDIVANIWASESNMSANVAINVVIEIIRANALGTRDSNTLVEIVRSTRTTEVAVTNRAVNNFTTGMLAADYTEQTLNRGDRLRIRVFGDDAGTMASGFTFNIGYNGTTAAADGDTYVTFTETFSFESNPGGSVVYLTDTSAGLDNFPQIADVQSGDVTSASATWALSYPTGLEAGDLIIAIIARDANTTTTFPAEFVTTISESSHTEAKTVALGTETGTFDVTYGSARVGSWAVYRITNWHGTLGTAFNNSTPTSEDVPTNSAVTGTSTAPNAGTLDPANWAAGESTLWITFAVAAANPTAYPYTDNQLALDRLMVCATQNTSGSEDAPAWTIDASINWAARTIAIRGLSRVAREAWTSRGGGVVNDVTNTVAGWTPAIQVTDTAGGTVVEWFTKPLQAFTLTGLALANLRALESLSTANASLRCEIARVDADGTNPTVWSSWCMSPVGTDVGELSTTETVETCYLSGDDLAISDGQRLRIRLYLDDISVLPMATGHTVTTYYNGTSAAASGDAYVTLAQTISEFVAATLVLEHGFVNFNDPGVL